ncbi:MAG: hypothetical protein EOM47_11205 [Bacteroidia bacterium]|nr:hypothetical protein [Bacteroidia bacterium]
MKKLTKKSLNELSEIMPVLSEKNQKGFIGGTGIWESTPDGTNATYVNTGTGFVTGSFDDDYLTGTIGGSGDVTGNEIAPTFYSYSEMETMMNNGTWIGGYVNGYGYVSTQVSVFNGDGKIFANGSDFAAGQHVGLWDNIKLQVIGLLPTGVLSGTAANMLSNANWSIASDLMEKNLTNIPIYYDYDANIGDYGTVRVYNASSGALIGSYPLGL